MGAGVTFSGAHPRVCGADRSFDTKREAKTGSSPRVRGRLAWRASRFCRLGLIPACAGQTLSKRPPWPAPRAHPRVCGADGEHDKRKDVGGGSSPRVRGRP